MRTVNEVSKMTGVSIRTLHYYDQIGLLSPTSITEAGYRLYDDTALERLQHIMLFRELQFPLKDIGDILNASNFDRNKALEQQIPRKTNGEYCPCCKRHLRKPKISVGYTGNVKKRNGDVYCPSCGQALDWNANKDKDTY